METRNITCPECGHNMDYWTKRNFINCVQCGKFIEVVPSEDIIEDLDVEDELIGE